MKSSKQRTYTLWERDQRYHAQRLEEIRAAGCHVGEHDIIKDGIKIGYHYHYPYDYYNAWGIVLLENCKQVFDFERD